MTTTSAVRPNAWSTVGGADVTRGCAASALPRRRSRRHDEARATTCSASLSTRPATSRPRAERHPDANLLRSSCDGGGPDTIEPERSEEPGQEPKSAHQIRSSRSLPTSRASRDRVVDTKSTSNRGSVRRSASRTTDGLICAPGDAHVQTARHARIVQRKVDQCASVARGAIWRAHRERRRRCRRRGY